MGCIDFRITFTFSTLDLGIFPAIDDIIAVGVYKCVTVSVTFIITVK